MLRSSFCFALVVTCASGAFAQDTSPAPRPPSTPATAPSTTEPAPVPEAVPSPPRSRQFRVGVQVGFTRFSSRTTSDTFGGNGFSLGPEFGGFRRGTRQGEVRPDFDVNVSRRNGNTLVLVPVGLRYAKTLAQSRNVPYVGASVNAVPAYSRVKTLGLGGKFSISAGASAFAGLGFGDKFNLEARYYLLSKVRGYSPSNFQIAAGVLF